MGQAISEFGVIRHFFENHPLNEDAYRIFQESLIRARNFQERMDKVLDTPIPHKEPMSALSPHLTDPWPDGHSPLFDDAPSRGLSPCDPCQTSNTTVLNPRSITSPPIPVVVGGKSTTQVVSTYSNAGGQLLT